MKYYIYQINNQVEAIGSNSNDSIESLEFDDSIYPVLTRTPKEALMTISLYIFNINPNWSS